MDQPSKCTWVPNTTEPTPHSTVPFSPEQPKILPNILYAIGHTPLVRVNTIGNDLKCELLVKCEFFNAGGSVKDRIGLRMIEDAENSGRIKKGDTLIEPTSGNTGIGLALTAAVKGYNMVITLPEKMSQEKVNVLKGLGADIIRTPTEAAFDSPESHIGVAERLNKEIPNSHILDQYSNPSNPLAHYDTTAEELIYQCDGKIDMIVIGAGTGGTISGIASKFKEKLPNCRIVAVDPHGSLLARPEDLNGPMIPYQVEGIGYDFIPKVLNHSVIDEWVKIDDKEAFLMARRMIREEGLLCGGSSGTAMAAALKVAKELGEGQRCVVVCPDSVRNYLSKFLNDEWMIDNGFMEPSEMPKEWWADHTIYQMGLPKPVTISSKKTVSEAITLLKEGGFDQIPVIESATGKIQGTITIGNLTAHVLSKRVNVASNLESVLYKKFKQVSPDTTLAHLSTIFNIHPFVVVCDESGLPLNVVTPIDLLNYVSQKQ